MKLKRQYVTYSCENQCLSRKLPVRAILSIKVCGLWFLLEIRRKWQILCGKNRDARRTLKKLDKCKRLTQAFRLPGKNFKTSSSILVLLKKFFSTFFFEKLLKNNFLSNFGAKLVSKTANCLQGI